MLRLTDGSLALLWSSVLYGFAEFPVKKNSLAETCFSAKQSGPFLASKLHCRGFLNTLVVGFVLSSLAYGLFPVYGTPDARPR